ncbi:MAG: LuxR C-terminal-related transcriptional regulator, partial [Treponema sp.]|nr:LuxR C-terminal-related transcriptional regulator [Treponema sp.]
YGKTTAVREFIEKSFPQSEDIYWFTAVDEVPAALYRRFCREIGKIDSRAGEGLLKIGIPNAFTIGECCETLRSIECRREAWLVIDNFQFFFTVLQPAFLIALMEHVGKTLHIVIVTQMFRHDFSSAITGRNFLHINTSDLQLKAVDIQHYYSLAGMEISDEQARNVFGFTNGWIIAVYLQLGVYRETGAFSDRAVLSLMERTVWDKLAKEQQDFFLAVSPFETVTARQICGLLKCDVLPDYALDCLSGPFIRYDPAERRYEPHSILYELIVKKRGEHGAAFERELLLRAGDLCRDEGRTAEAVHLYSQAKEYERLLSLDFSRLIYEEIGNRTFFDIALETVQNCPAEIKRKYPLSMLRVAWALRSFDKKKEFSELMEELDGQLPEIGLLRAEWLLLSVYLHYPHLEKMLTAVKKAAPLFGETCSQVILPQAPWAFGSYYQMTEFHLKPGKALLEADLLEKFIGIYSRLTNGHGSGADLLFRVELAVSQCDTAKAEVLAYKTMYLAENKRQSIIQLGAAMTLANIALLKADTAGWQNSIASMERAASHSGQNTSLIRTIMDIVRGSLLLELGVSGRIADWLKNYDLSNRNPPPRPGRAEVPLRMMLAPMTGNAWYVHSLYLLNQEEITRFIGVIESVRDEYKKISAYSDFCLSLNLGLGYAIAGNSEKAASLLEYAAGIVLPDGIMSFLAGYSKIIPGLIEEIIEKKYPEHLDHFNACKSQLLPGAETLHNAINAKDLPAGLSKREHEVALLAAKGLRNSEIAEKLFVSENTVRTHLRAVFQKLDIDRRAKLAEKLK